VAATAPAITWLEIHPENFLANPHARELLQDVATRYPISVHTVGVSIGSAGGIDPEHLARVRELVDAVDPFLVSGHLAWSKHAGEYLNENPSSYVGFGTSTMTEVEFFSELVRQTGCRLLCDVSNVFLSGHNMGFDPYAYIDAFPAAAVGELHLGGFTPEADEATPGAEVFVDTHAAPITEPVWRLYAHALRRFGPTPTLIEWDNDIPALDTLIAEAKRADAVAATVSSEQRSHALID
jgi:uncharacterized protein (UPF0276 family)